MALIYLVDTNIISEIEQMKPDPNVVGRLGEHNDQIALASISWDDIGDDLGTMGVYAGVN